MTNKEASYKQEHMVADYMEWSVVSGSGSRPFKPGDITSDYFLVECKTHIQPQDTIVFKKAHWDKIQIESQSTYKRPLLVTDDGTQKSDHTWVMLPLSIINSCSVVNVVDGWNNTSRSGNTIVFNHLDTKRLYEMKTVFEQTSVLIVRWSIDTDFVAIMPLSAYKEFYNRMFM